MSAEEELWNVTREVLDKNKAATTISPAWVATQVMWHIQFFPALHRLGYVGCHLQVRQIARELLRKHDPIEQIKDAVAGQSELFPDTLQEHYPKRRKKSEEPVYVQREAMTDDDVAYNVDRMRKGGSALLKHADALEAWGEGRPQSRLAA